MIAVYFPFTYVSPARAERLQAFFPSLAVYQPVSGRLPDEMARMQAQGFLEVVAPPPDDQERLESLVRQLREWGALHRQGVGIPAAGLAGRRGAAPLFDEEACARIVAEVKRRSQPADAAAGFDPLVPARLFLHLAQEFDRQNHELQSDLDGLDRRTADLFDSLKGRRTAAAGEGGPGAGRPDAPAGHLIEARLRAWARLYLSRPCPSAVFVTHSQGVVEAVLELVPAARRVLPEQGGFRALEAFCSGRPPTGDLTAELRLLAAAREVPPAPAAERTTGSAVYVLPGIAPAALWGRFAPAAASGRDAAAAGGGADCRNTLLVVVGGRG